jgi:putative hydrolase of the HAD superfamily
VDGVVVEGWPERQWDKDLQRDLGVPPKLLEDYVFRPHWDDFVTGAKPMMPVLEQVLRSAGQRATAQDVLNYYLDDEEYVNHGVVSAAKTWRARTGGALHLATNQEALRAEYLWDGIGLREHFDGMQVSCGLGVAKPDAAYFQRADEAMGVTAPGQVLFIDDLQENVDGARAHGWQAIRAKGEAEVVAVLGAFV